MFAKLPRLVAIAAILSSAQAGAATYAYEAICSESTSKQGEMSSDLSKQKGIPLTCDSVVISFMQNGTVMVQFSNKKSSVTPYGFSGGPIDYDINPNMSTVPLKRVYIPHSSNPEKAQVMDGIEGYCFISGKFNLKSLSGVSCVSKMEIGTQKLIFKLSAKFNGQGMLMPGP